MGNINRSYFNNELRRRRANTVATVKSEIAAGQRGTPTQQRNVRRSIIGAMRLNIREAVRKDMPYDGTCTRKELRQRRHKEVTHRLEAEVAKLGLTMDGELT